MSEAEVIDGTAVEIERAVVPVQPGQAIVAAETETGPLDMLARASSIATALAAMVERQKLYTVISGKKYPQVEAWMTIGRMDNVVAREAHPPVRQDDGAFEAEVELLRLSDGLVIGRASALCGSRGDRPWDSRPVHQRRSMAVTRATSRAFRQQYAWIMALAGYEPTPADEMPHDAPERPETPAAAASGAERHDGLVGTVARGRPPVDMELRQTPDGVAWGFKVTEGRRGYQALATGALAEALATAGLAEGQRVHVWGAVVMVPWQKDGKDMPPYARIELERVATDEWTLPSQEAPSEPMFRLDPDEAALVGGGLP